MLWSPQQVFSFTEVSIKNNNNNNNNDNDKIYSSNNKELSIIKNYLNLVVSNY